MIDLSLIEGTNFGMLRSLVLLRKQGHAVLAGNKRLRIYGRLSCASGKRMKSSNRVFFKSESEARALGYRPCGHCMKEAYRRWRHQDKDLHT